MTSTNDVPLRMARSRARQAREYSKAEPRPVLNPSGFVARDRTITLPTLKSIYGSKPVTYLDGLLMVADKIVRRRKGLAPAEVKP